MREKRQPMYFAMIQVRLFKRNDSRLPILYMVFLFLSRSLTLIVALFVEFLEETNNWSKPSPVEGSKPCARFGHSAICYGSMLCIYGGQSCSYDHEEQLLDGDEKQHSSSSLLSPSIIVHDDLYCFDTVTCTWSKVNTTIAMERHEISLSRHSHTAIPLPNGTMLAFGGAIGNNELRNDMWELNLKTKVWRQVKICSDSGIPSAREMHSACCEVIPYEGGEESIDSRCRIYVFGGRNADGIVLGDLWMLEQGISQEYSFFCHPFAST